MSIFKPVGTITLDGKSYYLDLRIEGVDSCEHEKIRGVAIPFFQKLAETRLDDLRRNEGVSLAWEDFKARAGIQEPHATVIEVDDEERSTPATNVSSGKKPAELLPLPVHSARKPQPTRTPVEQAARWKHFRDEVYKPIIANSKSIDEFEREDDKRVLNQAYEKFRAYELEESQKNAEIFRSKQGKAKPVKTFSEWLQAHIDETDKQSTAFSVSTIFAKLKGLIS